jgi:hypothetical protein
MNLRVGGFPTPLVFSHRQLPKASSPGLMAHWIRETVGSWLIRKDKAVSLRGVN